MEKRPISAVYAVVAIGGAAITGAASAIPWVYETFWAAEYRLEYSVQPPIEVVLADAPKNVWIIEVKNKGRKPIGDVRVILPPEVDMSHMYLQQDPGRVVVGDQNQGPLLPSEVMRITAVSSTDVESMEFSVRSNEVLGVKANPSERNNVSVVATSIITALVAIVYASAAYVFLVRRRVFSAVGDTNIMLLTASLFGQGRLLEQAWRSKMWMAYHGAAEIIYFSAMGNAEENSVKALFSLCVSPSMAPYQETEVVRIIAEMTGQNTGVVAAKVGELKAKSDKRSDVVDAIWAIKRMPIEPLVSAAAPQ